MFFTLEKLRKRVAELKERRYCGHFCIAPFVSMEGSLTRDQWYTEIPQKIQGAPFGIHDVFAGSDRYLWLEKTIKVPESAEGFEVVGLFDFGEMGANNAGFESMLYLNKHPYQGLDTNHKEVFFAGYESQDVTLTLLLWTGVEGNGTHRNFHHECKQAEFAYLHKKTDELYYFALAITETLSYLEPDSECYEDLMTALDRALLKIRWEEDDEFFTSAEEAHALLMASLAQMEKHTDITVHAIGHTHIDVAWLWRLKHTREKAQRSFSTVIRLMERYDEYLFLQTQPQLYKFIKEDCPELYAQIQQKVREGKWEAEGGMWVESDCNLPSGESLVRQLLHGTRFIEQEFGKKCEYLWLPDVFGYSWALPQILKLCEIDTFMTTKISWNEYNSIPNDLFRWRGIDGSEILTYFIDTPEVGRMTARFSTYNGMMEPRTVIGSWKRFKNKQLTKDILISYGYGDGGGGVTRDMLELRRVMDQLPGCPHVKPVKAGDFFHKLHQNVEGTDRYLPTWDGELYLEFHRGTYTTQGYNKKTNRKLEFRLTQLEWLSSLSYLLGGQYDRQQLHDCWECLLLHQFHDIIPGSSIHDVYEDSRVHYEKVQKTLDLIQEQVLSYLQKTSPDVYTVYSSNSFGGQQLVKIKEVRQGRFLDSDGNILVSQKTGEGYDVLVGTQPFRGVQIRFEEGDAEDVKPGFEISGQTLDTPYFRIRWNTHGQLTEVFDKTAMRNVLRKGQAGNVLEIFEDKPVKYDAWDVDIFYQEKISYPELIAAPVVVECNQLRVTLRFEYKYRQSKIVQDMICYQHTRRIDFNTFVDWHETHKLMKAAFYTDIRSTKATYDIQFGHVERPTHWNTSWDWARFEVCAHKWADLSETNYGVSLLNDCKYGYSIKDNSIKLTLLRSPKFPDAEADMGQHIFTYSLYPHIDNVVDGGTIEEANRLNIPALVVPGAMPGGNCIIQVSSSYVQIDAVKKAEDEECLIVRLHECRGGRERVTLSSELPIKKIVPCNLLEHDLGEPVFSHPLTCEFAPFEIKTFKLYV